MVVLQLAFAMSQPKVASLSFTGYLWPTPCAGRALTLSRLSPPEAADLGPILVHRSRRTSETLYAGIHGNHLAV